MSQPNDSIEGVGFDWGPTHLVSFDPGTTSGTFAFIDTNYDGTSDVVFRRLPLRENGRIDYAATVKLLESECYDYRTLYVIEDVWVMPKQGVSSSAKFIESYAAVRALFEQRARNDCTNDCVALRPQEWKKRWDLISKSSSCDLMLTEWPELRACLKLYSEKTGKERKGWNHNRADALLLARTAAQTKNPQ